MLTPLNITVIRFTHDGMLVKSMLVPDVEATAVPDTNGYVVPVLLEIVPVTAKPVEDTVAIVVPALCNCRVPVLSDVAIMPELVVALSELMFYPFGYLFFTGSIMSSFQASIPL